MVCSKWRGYTIIEVDGRWEYEDTGERVDEESSRVCRKCLEPNLPGEDHDPCLGLLPGVLNACCGHGERKNSYIQFENGVTVRGFIIDK